MRIMRSIAVAGAWLAVHALCQEASAAHISPFIVTVDDTDAGAQTLGLEVCDVFVQFHQDVHALLVIGNSDITTDATNGFYQHSFGATTSPLCSLLPGYPDLVYDSYVTFTAECDDGTDTTTLDPDFDVDLFNTGGGVVGGWYNHSPASGQGEQDANGQVRIAQFSVEQGFNVYGHLRIIWNSEGGLPIQTLRWFSCFCPSPPAADVNGDNWVNGRDLGFLLGHWGEGSGSPADFNDDGTVDAFDLAILLASWGPCLQ